MNYAWEAALAAYRSKLRPEEIRYLAVRDGSPYTEVVLEDLNSRDVGQGTVEVNPLYRFTKEFAALFDLNLQAYGAARELFFDAAMHYLVQQDLRQGLSKQEYALRFFLRDLLDGVCGSQAARVMGRFEGEALWRLLRLILKLYQCGSSLHLFREAMRCMYPDSLVYAANEEVRQVLVYLGEAKTDGEREKQEFLQDMFLPINYRVFLFWERHFGIVDVDETMVMDEMVLF